MIHHLGRLAVISVASLVMSACTSAGNPVLESGGTGAAQPTAAPAATPALSAQPTPGGPQSATPAPLSAVSRSAPTAAAADALAKCHIGDMIPASEVSGMAQLGAASEITRYVPLTGREPQLRDAGAVWVIQVHGDVQEPGGEVWTDPTCVVTQNDFGWFATGPARKTATGSVVQPERPPVPPDLALPTLAP